MTPSEKMQTPVAGRPVPYDPDRLFMSRDEVVAKDRKMKEIDAKLELQRLQLEAEYEKENEALENQGKEELKASTPKRAKKDVEEE